MIRQSEKQLFHLFNKDATIWTGSKFNLNNIENSEFFCINELKNLNNRTNENVLIKQNFLIEFDEGTFEQQEAAISLIEATGLNIATAVFSGSKSIHLIISAAESLDLEYRQTWLALAAEIRSITGLTPDAACKNEARLSRLAGAIRPETGLEQRLLHVGGFVTNEKFAKLAAKHQIKTSVLNTSKVPLESSMDLENFKIKLEKHTGLWSKLRGVRIWAKHVNMYPEILKLTIWAVETTGVPKNVFLEYAEQKIFPHLLNAGYPADKLDKAIHNAYDYLS